MHSLALKGTLYPTCPGKNEQRPISLVSLPAKGNYVTPHILRLLMIQFACLQLKYEFELDEPGGPDLIHYS